MSAAPPAGYSGNPLAAKLGIKTACRLCVLGDVPAGYSQLPPGFVIESQAGAAIDSRISS